jgi:hypothetical protein
MDKVVRNIPTNIPFQQGAAVSGYDGLGFLRPKMGSEIARSLILQGAPDAAIETRAKVEAAKALKKSREAKKAAESEAEAEAGEQTPWLLYGAIGAVGLAAIGLGYVILKPSKPKRMGPPRRMMV